jgi:hypothetical protein
MEVLHLVILKGACAAVASQRFKLLAGNELVEWGQIELGICKDSIELKVVS